MKALHFPEEFTTHPMRPAHRGDRWRVAFDPRRREWYAEPNGIGVWATKTAKQVFFPTSNDACTYARRRATQR